jgi:RNA polymerase sigma-70 factor (ECF subfamily)
MQEHQKPFSTGTAAPQEFKTTLWMTVAEAGRQDGSLQSQQALEKLCRTYWYPLYVFLRRQGHSPEDAEDLTQAFFGHMLEKNGLRHADPERGRFRTFLLSSLKHFVTDEWKKHRAKKRGGGMRLIELDAEIAEDRYRIEPVERLDPEKLFKRRWAMTLLDEALAQLEGEYSLKGKHELFSSLQPFLLDKKTEVPQSELALRMRMKEATLNSEVFRLRGRFRDLVREEIAQTVTTAAQIDDEVRELFAALAT